METREKDSLHPRSPGVPGVFPQCPVLNVIRAHECGLVVESNRSFDVGEAVTLGFHVPNSESPDDRGCFISAESLVVESRRSWSRSRGDFRHRVTLLFSKIAAEDRDRLIDLVGESFFQKPQPPGSESLN